MKRNQILKLLGVALTSFIVTSCSNDIEQNGDNGKVDISKATTFKLNFADYNTDTEASGTRAGKDNTPDSVKLKPIELGHGILAYPTLVKDKQSEFAKKAATRSLGNESYTMLAYKNGTLVGEMTGTASDVSGTATFTPTSSNTSIQLVPGTYDFVCYTTNYVTRNGNELTINPYYGEKALIGRAENVTVNGVKQEIPFTMKHVTARLRIKIKAMRKFDSSTATLSGISNDIPRQAIYNASTGTYGYASGAFSTSFNMPASTQPYGPGVYNESISSNYNYYMPGTDPSKLKINISGSFYNSYMNGYFNVQPGTAFTFNANESYILRFDIMYDYLYLFSDGTIGHFTDTTKGGGTKTAIGIVVSQSKRLAMALKPSTSIYSPSVVDPGYTANIHTPFGISTSYNNKIWNGLSGDWYGLSHDEDGYAYTWLPSGSGDGATIKATSTDATSHKPNFPAFYAAAHYNEELTAEGITLAPSVGAGKWFLPTFAQVYNAFSSIGFADPIAFSTPPMISTFEGTVENLDQNMLFYALNQPLSVARGSFSFMATSSEIHHQYQRGSFAVFYNYNNTMTWFDTPGSDLSIYPFINY